MHECQNCGQACDCDGEDTWHEWDSEEADECCCDCWEEEDDCDDMFDYFNDREGPR